MEVEMNKYVIQYENGRSVTVTARNLGRCFRGI
jgi:hypothetical protein